jgi:hypothetical protein
VTRTRANVWPGHNLFIRTISLSLSGVACFLLLLLLFAISTTPSLYSFPGGGGGQRQEKIRVVATKKTKRTGLPPDENALRILCYFSIVVISEIYF